MAILLGIDTGGTYTDAVLLDDARPRDAGVVASAKALTTRHDLSIGIAEAMDAVCGAESNLSRDIALVSLSTTLATNAVVEGQGGRVGLVLAGFGPEALERAGLRKALGDDPWLTVAGGHTAHGAPVHDVDLDAVRRWLAETAGDVAGFAVAGAFGVRNPEHELAIRDLLRAETGRPVTCSHELSSKLDGPRRALTCVLNARLIGLIDELISSTSTLLEARGIAAPLMVVRGDGALIAAEVARTCPVETVLSGPAASLVGAAWLHETERAIVSDIGGTTTDVALLSEGRPRLDPAGATVGGWRTMVEAVGMWTVGLGGDSEVRLERDGLAGVIALGPRRAVPLSLLAQTHRGLVLETLKRQARKDRIDERDGVFALQVRDAGLHGGALRDVEKKLLSQLADGPVPLDKLISVRMQLGALEKLVGRGIVMMASFTPSDAAHVLERYEAWNGDAARFGAKIFARRRTAAGKEISGDAETVSAMVLDALTRRSAETVLEAAFSHDGFDGAAAVSHPLVAAGLAHHDGAVKIDVGLSIPLIGLGASARTYYPAVGERLGVEAIVPTHAGVANAVGAVVGHVQISDQAVISQPEAGRFRVHLPGLVEAFSSQQDAIVFAERELGDMLSLRAEEAGAGDISLTFAQDVKTVEADGQEIFIEAVISGVARGRPRFQAADVG